MQKIAIVNTLTSTKNKEVFMANTALGGFMVRKSMLEKRGIQIPNGTAYKFPEPTVVIVRTHKKGDYLFPDNGGIATQDSSRLNDAGEPFYKKGDKPVWEDAGESVQSFVAFNDYKAQLELEALQRGLISQ